MVSRFFFYICKKWLFTKFKKRFEFRSKYASAINILYFLSVEALFWAVHQVLSCSYHTSLGSISKVYIHISHSSIFRPSHSLKSLFSRFINFIILSTRACSKVIPVIYLKFSLWYSNSFLLFSHGWRKWDIYVNTYVIYVLFTSVNYKLTVNKWDFLLKQLITYVVYV